jgi:hypothetical protein
VKSHCPTRKIPLTFVPAKDIGSIFLTKVISQNNKKDFTFDSVRTRELVNLLEGQPAIGKIFIEPHLITRLSLTTDKIRFHGCQAVRHDDHIHIQLQ